MRGGAEAGGDRVGIGRVGFRVSERPCVGVRTMRDKAAEEGETLDVATTAPIPLRPRRRPRERARHRVEPREWTKRRERKRKRERKRGGER